MSFPRYPAYKDSGVPWFGKVPAHWQVGPLKAFIDRIESGVSVNATDTPAEGDQFGVLKTSCVYTGQFDATENKAVVNAEYDRVACPVEANTLIVSRMNTPDLVGAAGLTKADHPTLFLPDRLWQVFPKDTRADFMHFWTRTASYRAQVEMACAGTSSSMQNLGQDDFRSFMFVSPPSDEQAEIADFLDRETAKIDALVGEQEQLITLLKEKRQAVISHAVTKGLDPSVPMKDSSVEWLGEVPAHWTSSRIKFSLSGLIDTEHKTVPFVDDGEYLVVRTSNIRNGRLVLDDAKYTDQAGFDEWTRRATPKAGDIIFTREAPAGEAWVVDGEIACCLGQRTVLMQMDTSVLDPQFALWSIYGGLATEFVALLSQGSTVAHFNMSDIGSIPLLLPPIDEQMRVATQLKTATEQIDELLTEATAAISLFQERRSALISAAVTGQIDVRGLAPAQEQAA